MARFQDDPRYQKLVKKMQRGDGQQLGALNAMLQEGEQSLLNEDFKMQLLSAQLAGGKESREKRFAWQKERFGISHGLREKEFDVSSEISKNRLASGESMALANLASSGKVADMNFGLGQARQNYSDQSNKYARGIAIGGGALDIILANQERKRKMDMAKQLQRQTAAFESIAKG